jgi:hypothetical protein
VGGWFGFVVPWQQLAQHVAAHGVKVRDEHRAQLAPKVALDQLGLGVGGWGAQWHPVLRPGNEKEGVGASGGEDGEVHGDDSVGHFCAV